MFNFLMGVLTIALVVVIYGIGYFSYLAIVDFKSIIKEEKENEPKNPPKASQASNLKQKP